MNKYINIILISFFSVLTYQYGFGFTFFIPIVLFLANYNMKNLILIIPISLISFYFTLNKILILLLLYLFLLLYFLLLKKKSNNIIDSIYLFLINFLILLIIKATLNQKEIIMSVIYSIFSVLIYLYFIFNIKGALTNNNSFRNYGFVETIMGLIMLYGATTISIKGINISIFVGMFYAMYMSQNGYSLLSIFYSIIAMFILKMFFSIEEAIFLPFISAFYLFPSIYGTIILICFCLFGWISDFQGIDTLMLQITIIVSILFELFKFTVINTKNNKAEIIEDVYNQAISNVNNEIIGFASFLDLYSKEFASTHHYNQKISEGVNSLLRCYCESCYMKKECDQVNKNKKYIYLKNMITYAGRDDYDNSRDALSFFKKCPYIVEMRKSAIILNEKMNLSKETNKSNTLVAQMNGISNVLRQYSVDNALKNEFEYGIFYKIKKAICDYGYNVCYFNPKKILVNDFLIEFGVRGVGFNDIKSVVEKICDNYITNKTTVVFQKVEKGKTYMNLIPKINYIIDYGYGSLAQEGNSVSGDNLLIKELGNSKLVAAISDGMGKGYIANKESNTTLKLIDEVTNVDISTSTSLQILNTFYFIQDYLEKYSTLDFLEIDRNKGEVLFYKLGASTSYIFHKNGTYEKIENESLPFGIEEMIETKSFEIDDQDIIIMTSDGVFENMEKEEDLKIYIQGIMHMSPQNITYEILKYAKENRKKVEDDMCVITLKIKEVY